MHTVPSTQHRIDLTIVAEFSSARDSGGEAGGLSPATLLGVLSGGDSDADDPAAHGPATTDYSPATASASATATSDPATADTPPGSSHDGVIPASGD